MFLVSIVQPVVVGGGEQMHNSSANQNPSGSRGVPLPDLSRCQVHGPVDDDDLSHESAVGRAVWKGGIRLDEAGRVQPALGSPGISKDTRSEYDCGPLEARVIGVDRDCDRQQDEADRDSLHAVDYTPTRAKMQGES